MGFAMDTAARLVLHHNIDIFVEAIEETAEPIEREVFQLSPYKRRYFGLVNAENRRRGGLVDASLADDLDDLHGQLRFRQMLFGVGKFQIGKNIIGTVFNGFRSASFGHRHFLRFFSISIACLRRRSISSRSGFGVAIPDFDFFFQILRRFALSNSSVLFVESRVGP